MCSRRTCIDHIDLSIKTTVTTKKERTVANSLPGVVQEEGAAESDEEVEDAKLVHLSTKLVLPARLNQGQTALLCA